MLLQELWIPIITTHILWYDNLGALSLATNPIFHSRTKYIEIDFHFIREKSCQPRYHHLDICTIYEVANIFTKGPTSAQLCCYVTSLGLPHHPLAYEGMLYVYQHQILAWMQAWLMPLHLVMKIIHNWTKGEHWLNQNWIPLNPTLTLSEFKSRLGLWLRLCRSSNLDFDLV